MTGGGGRNERNSFTHVQISTLRRRILISARWIVSPRVVKLAASDGELQWKRSTYQWLSLALFTFLACPWLSTDRIYIYIYIYIVKGRRIYFPFLFRIPISFTSLFLACGSKQVVAASAPVATFLLLPRTIDPFNNFLSSSNTR